MRKVSDRRCRGNQNTICYTIFVVVENHAVYENVGQYRRPRESIDDSISTMAHALCMFEH